jgi:ppGpp synthetase/RelA/SpoT-type nucleotidyltranferase
MIERTVEDRLREEYFALLPDVRRVLEQLEAEVRHCLLPLLNKLDRDEKVTVASRIKECESALGALKRRQEGNVFDPDQSNKYSLKTLNDLAGVRVMAFPSSRWVEVDHLLRENPQFVSWTSDPVRLRANDEKSELLAFKYHGHCSRNAAVRAELQIVPMLIGLFWQVEHSAIYKPRPGFKDALDVMGDRTIKVYEALTEFESEFERLIRLDAQSQLKKRKKKKKKKKKKR